MNGGPDTREASSNVADQLRLRLPAELICYATKLIRDWMDRPMLMNNRVVGYDL